MGTRLHYKALMRKNWILWKRNLCMSICEFMCPVVLFGLILMIRQLITIKEISPESFLDEAQVIYPFDGGLQNAEKEFEDHSIIDDVLVANLYTSDLSFYATECKSDRDWMPEKYKVGIAGKKDADEAKADPVYKYVIERLENHFEQIYAVSNNPSDLIELLEIEEDSDFARQIYFAASRMPKTKLEMMYFGTFEEMEDYTRRDLYMRDDDEPGICFGFGIDELDNGYEAEMFYFDNFAMD